MVSCYYSVQLIKYQSDFTKVMLTFNTVSICILSLTTLFVTGSAKTEHNSTIKHWVINVYFEKIHQVLYPPCSWWKNGPTVKNWVSFYLPKQVELENFCLVAVRPRNCKLWLFVHVTSKWLFAIDVSSWIFTWWKWVEEITYPVIHSSVHGKRDGAKFKPAPHFIRKLHPF